MKPQEALLAIAELATSQWGLITTPQAIKLGCTRVQIHRLVEQGRLERVQHGVYAVTGAPVTPIRELQAAWLSLDAQQAAYERLGRPDVAVVSHTSAADLLGLGNTDADYFEFTTPARKQTRRDDLRLYRADIPRQERTLVMGLPVTTAIRTVRDLAASGLDGGHLALVVRDAVFKAAADTVDLAKGLEPFAQRYGASRGDGEGLVERFIDEAGVPTAVERISAKRWQGIGETIGSVLASQLGTYSRFADISQLQPLESIEPARRLQPALEALFRTERGQELIDQMARMTPAMRDLSFASLPPEQMAKISELMSRVGDNLQFHPEKQTTRQLEPPSGDPSSKKDARD
jgi:predicted transcriptional regulator of viral defense system